MEPKKRDWYILQGPKIPVPLANQTDSDLKLTMPLLHVTQLTQRNFSIFLPSFMYSITPSFIVIDLFLMNATCQEVLQVHIFFYLTLGDEY